MIRIKTFRHKEKLLTSHNIFMDIEIKNELVLNENCMFKTLHNISNSKLMRNILVKTSHCGFGIIHNCISVTDKVTHNMVKIFLKLHSRFHIPATSQGKKIKSFNQRSYTRWLYKRIYKMEMKFWAVLGSRGYRDKKNSQLP